VRAVIPSPSSARPGDGLARRERDGMTIVEVVVAILMLSVGLLALAGLAAGASKAIRGGGTQVVAAAVAQSRFDSLSSVPCATLANGGATSGSSTTRGITERWSVTDGRNIKRLADSIDVPGRTKKLVYLSVIPCRD
jgi:type II secretory pathway pseudopilin PulG